MKYTEALLNDAEEPLRGLLRAFTYKPRWVFRVERGFLIIQIIAIDTDNIDQTIQVNFAYEIPLYYPNKYPWERWLLERIRETEDHETREFFKINGVKVFDPHG